MALAANYDAGEAWKVALNDAISHVVLVAQNNPLKPMSQILKRPDVREALSWPFARAGAETLAAVREAWYEQAGDLILPEDDLKKVIANVKKNATSAPLRLKQAVAKGPKDKLAERLQKLADDFVRRAEFAVEYAREQAKTLALIAAAPESALKTWRRNPHSDSCSVCIELDGVTIPIGDPFVVEDFKTFGTFMGPQAHPRCLPGDALVTSRSRILGATSRVFDGEMVEVRTLRENTFTATPNHPVLTGSGWVALGEIQQGDYLISSLSSERTPGVAEHNQHVPVPIKEIAEAFLGSGQVTTREVPVASVDFHGDGAGSEVAVVGTYGRLPLVRDLEVVEILSEEIFQSGSSRDSGFSSLCVLHQSLFRDRLTSDSFVGSSGHSKPLLLAASGVPDELRFAQSSRLNPVFNEYAADDGPGDGVALRDALLRLSGEVALDEVLSVRRYPFVGHVYNLETEDGWYIGNSIVTHNCQCHLEIS